MKVSDLTKFKEEVIGILDVQNINMANHQRSNRRTLKTMWGIIAVAIIFVFINTSNINKLLSVIDWVNHLRENTISTKNVEFLFTSLEQNMELILEENPSKEQLKKYSDDYKALRKNIIDNNKARTRGTKIN